MLQLNGIYQMLLTEINFVFIDCGDFFSKSSKTFRNRVGNIGYSRNTTRTAVLNFLLTLLDPGK